MNKKALNNLIANLLQQKCCHIIYADSDADVDIVSTAIKMSSYKSTTLIREVADLLVMLLYYVQKEYKELYFGSDKEKSKPVVYNIKVLRQLLGDGVISYLLLVHAFTGCDTTSGIFWVGEKTEFKKLVKDGFILHESSQVYDSLNVDKSIIESTGCKAMMFLFKGRNILTIQQTLQESVQHKDICQTGKTAANIFGHKASLSANLLASHAVYVQKDSMDFTDWGWKLQEGKYAPLTMDKNPAPDKILKFVRCN
ncbi:hypothetical protein PR048_011734 [Dryococelus australis]|uniref:Uncharacterized protein n=1 Tax=Dryococelus australis TaxID=614101 RepID=A0ABQ9HMG9_9NEOP|nr:hypothetical protein PR048_011734 [Dryococelus australis]